MTAIYLLYALAIHSWQSPLAILSYTSGDQFYFAVNLDTDVTVVDATCDNTANGSISLIPQSGVSPYTYIWSIGGNTSTQTNLLPGTYFVTVTDNVGTTEAIEIMVGATPGTPIAQATILDGCSFNPQEEFDLTTVESVVNAGTGFEVIWYENPNLTGEILFPETFFTGGATVYAVVNNGTCQSAPVPVVLTLYLTPTGNPTSLRVCDDDHDGFGDFDLTVADDFISGGNGVVSWYLSNNLTNPILQPTHLATPTQFIYAYVFDGHCLSPPTFIWVEAIPIPVGVSIDTHFCGDASGQIQLDLMTLDAEVNNGVGTVQWYSDAAAMNLIPNPGNFQTSTITIYGVITNQICVSEPFPVDLIIDASPAAMALTISACDEGFDMAHFVLPDYEAQISGGSGVVTWFFDSDLLNAIPNPNTFISSSTTVYALVDNGVCTTGPVPIQLNVIQEPTGNIASLTSCADMTGQGFFNLNLLDAVVNSGAGTVSWYEDAAGLLPIPLPEAFLSSGTVVYAQINEAGCLSAFIPVTLIISNAIVATPTQIALCDDGSGTPVFDLTQVEDVVSGGMGVVNWYLDPAGMNSVPLPATYASDNAIVYAQVVSGTCVSAIVPIQLIVLPLPQVISISIDVCEDFNGQALIDLTFYDPTISANAGTVTWYRDIGLANMISDPVHFLTNATTLYAVVSNGNCTSGAVPINVNILSELNASSLRIQLCVTDLDTPTIDLTDYQTQISGGVGTVIWFYDKEEMDTIFSTTVFSATGDTLYAKVFSGDCASELVFIPVELFFAFTPQPSCEFTSIDSVSIRWPATADTFQISYLINGQPVGGSITTTDTVFHLGDLNQGDEVTLTIESLYNSVCTTSLSNSIACLTEDCPAVTLSFEYADFICTADDPFQLEVMAIGLSGTPEISWSGEGVTNPSGIYDPSLPGAGNNTVVVTIQDGNCTYMDSVELHTRLSPNASFVFVGSPCIDSTIELLFNGLALGNADWHWDFSKASVMPQDRPEDFYLSWGDVGLDTVSLFIDFLSCLSDTFSLPIYIGEAPKAFSVSCTAQDYNSIEVAWDPVEGANSYAGSSSDGNGVLSGTTFTVSGLEDNTVVDIQIEAYGIGDCGPTKATIQCKTREYIESIEFIPNLFSPNGDGINDIIFVQTNDAITEISTFRISDRWGNLVFENQLFMPNDPAEGWDGMFKGKPMNTGVFLYWIEMKTEDGKRITRKGDVTLLR